MVRRGFYAASVGAVVVLLLAARAWPAALWAFALLGPVIAVGLYDSLQRDHTILRNFRCSGTFAIC